MILIVAIAINGDGDRGRGGSSGDDGNDRNSDNSDGSGRNGADWEIEQIKGTDSEEMVLATVELGMGVTAEGI
jgi:hypothetical protein